jgi:hypothetical protein
MLYLVYIVVFHEIQQLQLTQLLTLGLSLLCTVLYYAVLYCIYTLYRRIYKYQHCCHSSASPPHNQLIDSLFTLIIMSSSNQQSIRYHQCTHTCVDTPCGGIAHSTFPRHQTDCSNAHPKNG